MKKGKKLLSLILCLAVVTTTLVGSLVITNAAGWDYGEWDDDYDFWSTTTTSAFNRVTPRKPANEYTTRYYEPITEPTTRYVEPTTERTTEYVPPTTERTTEYVPPVTERTTEYVPPTTERTTEYIPPTTERTTVYVEPTTERTTKYVEPTTIFEPSTKITPVTEPTTMPTTMAPTVEPTTMPTTFAPVTMITTVVPVTETKVETTTHSHDTPIVREYSVNMKVGDTNNLPVFFLAGQYSYNFNWDCSNKNVAVVDNSGSVYALRSGIVTVTAYSKIDSFVYIFAINITGGGQSEQSRDLTIYNGNDMDLSRYVQYDARDYTWNCSNTSRGRIDRYGEFTTRAAGNVTVTATYNYAITSNIVPKYTFYISIKDKSSGSSSKGVITRYYDKKMTLYVPTGESVDFSHFLDKAPSTYSWSTSNTGIVNYYKNTGKLLGVKAGTTTVYIEGTHSYAVTVRVSDKYNSYYKEMKVGEAFDVKKYLTYDTSYYKFSTYDNSEIRYSSGTVSAHQEGTSYIICDGSKETVQIIVNVNGKVQSNSTTTTNTNKTNTNNNNNNNNNNNSNNNNNNVSSKFNDVADRAWAITAIENMANKGFIVGRGNGKFVPDDKCTKADFSIVLAKMLGLDNSTGANENYSDVEDGAYFAKYVSVLKKNNLTAGVSGNSFFPKNNITREEIMDMVYRGLEYKGVQMNTDTSILNSYTDVGDIDPEYRQAVAGLLSIKAINGTSATTIEPNASITRAQMAVLINNFYGKIS